MLTVSIYSMFEKISFSKDTAESQPFFSEKKKDQSKEKQSKLAIFLKQTNFATTGNLRGIQKLENLSFCAQAFYHIY